MFMIVVFTILANIYVLVAQNDTKLLLQIADDTYKKVIPCIINNKYLENKKKKFHFPSDARSHYTELLLQTARYRGVKQHEAAGYNGPWLENYFISHFMEKPLEYFNGLIPLFIQWVDIHVFEIDHEPHVKWNASIPKYKTLHTEVSKLLREDVIYFTVSQDDQGLHRLAAIRPNILVMSAGGYGHIPIPLLKEVHAYVPPPDTYDFDIGFYGNHRPRTPRGPMMTELAQKMRSVRGGVKYKFEASASWKGDILVTKFNLAPRGFGRTSYRLAEVIQLGRLPVLLYDDVPWIPYMGTNASIQAFGFAGQSGHLGQMVDKLLSVTSTDLATRLEAVKKAREHYTYDGVLRQIALFLADPLGPGGGHLRCTRVPERMIRN